MVDICLSLLLNHIVIAHHSGAHESSSPVCGVRVAQSLVQGRIQGEGAPGARAP